MRARPVRENSMEHQRVGFWLGRMVERLVVHAQYGSVRPQRPKVDPVAAQEQCIELVFADTCQPLPERITRLEFVDQALNACRNCRADNHHGASLEPVAANVKAELRDSGSVNLKPLAVRGYEELVDDTSPG